VSKVTKRHCAGTVHCTARGHQLACDVKPWYNE